MATGQGSEFVASSALVRSGFASDEEIRQCVAQWLHGMPVDRDRFLKVLPRPDRSDWRNDEPESEPAESQEDIEDREEQEQGEEEDAEPTE